MANQLSGLANDLSLKVIGNSDQQNKFFLVMPPGFERVALYELTRTLREFDVPTFNYEIFAGGIELSLPIEVGLALNHYLRVPTRILLRIGHKEILSFQDFQKWIQSLQMQKYLPFKTVYVSSRTSKMKMKEKIKESFIKTLNLKSNEQGTDVYVRFFRDECTISIDTSGEDLFVRGRKKWVGEAPLRDNMAACLLQLALQGVDDLNEWQVVDPMMGSGTFLLEAVDFHQPLTRPFAYQNWFTQNVPTIEARAAGCSDVMGFDLVEKNVEIVKNNFSTIKNVQTLFKQQDLFRGSKVPKTKKRLVILNPPYGKRLKIKMEDFFQNIFTSVADRFDADRVALLLPRGGNVEQHPGYQQVRYLEFSNNSIDVHFHLYLKF